MPSLQPTKLSSQATLLIALIASLIATVSMHAQSIEAHSRQRNVLSVGVQIADESNGEFGAAIALERNLHAWNRRFSLGGGIITGIRRSHFKGILGSDYSVLVVPVSGLLNMHYRIPSVSQLDVYAGPYAGVSLRRYRSESCALEFDCVVERTSPVAGGAQWGARWEFRNALHLWSETSTGNQGFTFAIGIARSF